MAEHDVAVDDLAAHGQLAAGVTDTVKLIGRDLDSVEVGTDGTSEVWVSVDGHDPVTNGTDQKAIRFPAVGGWSYATLSIPTAGDTVVKLKCAVGTPLYDVNG